MFPIDRAGKVRILEKRFIKQTVPKKGLIRRFDKKTPGKMLLSALHLQIPLSTDHDKVSLVVLYS